MEMQTSSVDNQPHRLNPSIRFEGLISIRYYAAPPPPPPLAASRALATCLHYVVNSSMCTVQVLAPV